ncbi:TPA: hypothetical protein N3A33_000510 [Salmonella enterica subsp. salamae serovar 28:r:e,n,z15]|nr:hypothetical protein [Salmonella enterica subsp. salamae serovar 28:r:e,n,z15]
MDNEDEGKYNRISVEVNMKDGIKIDAPAGTELIRAVTFAVRVIALGIVSAPVLYGVAKVILAVAAAVK